jgi:excisionase family DNA binding protein
MAAATYTADELAERLGVSSWAVYQAVRAGSPPVPVIRVGRRVLFARAAVDRLLGLPDLQEAP